MTLPAAQFKLLVNKPVTYDNVDYPRFSQIRFDNDKEFLIAARLLGSDVTPSKVDGTIQSLDLSDAVNLAEDVVLDAEQPVDPQRAYLKPSVNVAGAGFGLHCAIDGDIAVVGAFAETGGGAAYVFRLVDGVWLPWQRLVGANTGSGDQFGVRVAISGTTIVVGANLEDGSGTGVDPVSNDSASNAGAAYVFIVVGDAWVQQAYLKASNTETLDQFGFDVAIWGDTIAVSAPIEKSNATGIGGDQSNNSITGAGAVYVFTRTLGVWSQQAYVKASNTTASLNESYNFGIAIALHVDTLVVGQSGDLASAVGVGAAQTRTAANNSAGSVMVFTRTAGVWTQQIYIRPPVNGAGDVFGSDVSVYGDLLVVGSQNEDSAASGVNGDGTDNTLANSGCAHVYRRTTGVWAHIAYLKASNPAASDLFGFDTAVRGNLIVITATGEDGGTSGVNGLQTDNSEFDSGAAYLFDVDGNTVTQRTYIKSSNPNPSDAFGRAVGLGSDGLLIIGAFGEDSNATGVDGDQSDNGSSGAGAAYIFDTTLMFAVAA